jgi:RNA polymerase sigma-70 factor (ECF subfamily)
MTSENEFSQEKILTLGQQASEGDVRAFGELYQYFLPKIFGYFSARVKKKEVSEELTSTVFLKVAENIKTFSAKKGMSFSGWIFRIAHNVLVDYWRAKKATITTESEEACAIPSQENLSKETEVREHMRAVEKCLDRLPLTEREIIRMRAWEGCEYEEIGEIVGKKSGAIRMALSRALEKMRTCLEGFHVTAQDI